MLTGPIVHLAHDRRFPALISFLGWGSVAATSALVDAWYGSVIYRGSFYSATAGLPPALTIAAVGAGLMTSLDVYMARTVKEVAARNTASWLPCLTVSGHGGSVGVMGRF